MNNKQWRNAYWVGLVSQKLRAPDSYIGAPISHGLSPRKLENVKNTAVKNQWENAKLIMLNNKASIGQR
jgi:hypothetical protein